MSTDVPLHDLVANRNSASLPPPPPPTSDAVLVDPESGFSSSDSEELDGTEVALPALIVRPKQPWYWWVFFLFPKYCLRKYVVFWLFLMCGLAIFIPLAITKFHCGYEGWATGILLIIQVSWLACDVSPTHYVTLTMVYPASSSPPPSSLTLSMRTHPLLVLQMGMLMLFRILEPSQALVGFGNTTPHTIAVVLIITANIDRSQFLQYISRYLWGRPKYEIIGRLRVFLPAALVSTVVLDTPTVTFFLPQLRRWVRQQGFKESHFLMPLSFAALLGGSCTVIGSSANILVLGLVEQYKLGINVGFFDTAEAAGPVMLVGVLYMVLFARFLPHRTKPVKVEPRGKYVSSATVQKVWCAREREREREREIRSWKRH
jgi:di/tricarboxylate transporter